MQEPTPINLQLNFHSGKLPPFVKNKQNNTIINCAPRGKHVLIKISRTEAVLITQSGNAYTGLSSNIQHGRNIKWKVNSKLLNASSSVEHINKLSAKTKSRKYLNKVSFFTLSIQSDEDSLNELRILEKSQSQMLESLSGSPEHTREADFGTLKIKGYSTNECSDEPSNTQCNVEAAETIIVRNKVNRPTFIQKCDECGVIFPRIAELKLHVKESGHLLARCRLCGEGFKTRKTLATHYVKHTGKQNFVCNICGKSFYGERGYKAHKKIHLGIRKYQCSTCGKAFLTPRHLEKHEYIHKPYSERPFGCSECKTRFIEGNELDKHMRRHKGVLNFLCELCGGAFGNNSDLLLHTRTEHSAISQQKNGGNYKPKKIYKKYVLPEEAVLTGEELYKYKCKKCGKLSKVLSELYQHIRRHAGIKQYGCRFCDFKFVTMSAKSTHEKVHTNDRKHVCEICGKTYIHRKDLKVHSLVHMEKSFHCKECDRSFAYKGNYDAHINLHLGQKLYECTVCNKNMLRKSNFGTRVAVDMSCDYCGKTLKLVRSKVKTKKFIEARKNI